MSGHSHWSKIKWKKEISDSKKGKAFSKMAKEISITARESGGDVNFNPKLRTAIEKARSIKMPAENIERAVKKGTGELKGEVLEAIIVEAYGPGGAAIIIEGITDNKNRSLNEIKQILSMNNGKVVGEGGVRWMFDRKVKKDESGFMEWIPKQEIELPDKDKEACQKLFEALDESDDVQEIYFNIKLQDEDEEN